MPLVLWCPDLVAAGPRRRERPPRGHRADGPRRARRRSRRPSLPGRSLLAAVARRRRPTSSYFESLSVAFNRGWAPLRGLLLGRKEVHRPARCRSSTTCRPIPPSRRTSSRRIGTRSAACASSCSRPAGRPPRTRPHRRRRGREAPEPRLPVRRRRRAKTVVRPGRRPEEPDRRRPAAPPGRRALPAGEARRGDPDRAAHVVAEHPTMKTGYLQLAFLLSAEGRRAGALDGLRGRLAARSRGRGAGPQAGAPPLRDGPPGGGRGDPRALPDERGPPRP